MLDKSWLLREGRQISRQIVGPRRLESFNWGKPSTIGNSIIDCEQCRNPPARNNAGIVRATDAIWVESLQQLRRLRITQPEPEASPAARQLEGLPRPKQLQRSGTPRYRGEPPAAFSAFAIRYCLLRTRAALFLRDLGYPGSSRPSGLGAGVLVHKRKEANDMSSIETLLQRRR